MRPCAQLFNSLSPAGVQRWRSLHTADGSEATPHFTMKTILSRTVASWPLAVILLLPSPMHGATATPAWVQRYNGPGNGDDVANAVAVDVGGNVLVTGGSYDTGTGYDYVTIKYSSVGVPLWTNRYNGPANGNDYAQVVALDGSGDVYVTGYSQGNGTAFDYATVKYSSGGVPLWTNRYNGPASGVDRANALALDSNTNVCVTGQSADSGNGYDYVTIMYSSAGVPLWTNRYNGPGNGDDVANALAVDGSNNICVTGYSFDSGSFLDFATIKYSSAGVPLWTNGYNGPANDNDVATAVEVDSIGGVVVFGYSRGSGTSDDYATIKYSSAGVPLWTNRYNGPGNGPDVANAVAVDGSNNVYVTGYSPGGGTFLDYATIKYSSAGVPLWTNRYNGLVNANDLGIALAADNSGNVFVTGHSDGSGSASDYATLAYSTAGLLLWTSRYNGPANGTDQPLTKRSLALAGHGSVVVVGRSQGINAGSTNYDWAVVKYVSLPSVIGLTNLGPTAWQLSFSAMPGLPYLAQVATNLTTSPWFHLSTNTAGSNGLWTVIDTAATNKHRFYRVLAR